MMRPISEEERFARLRLARSDSIGPVTFRDLLQNCGNAINALEALPDLARRGHRKNPLRIATEKEIERELNVIKKMGCTLIVIGDDTYPAQLAALDPVPPVFSIKGDISLLARQSIAIVGSRNASAAGTRMSGLLARDLGKQGYITISGLARGIDAAAHRASLMTGTIAVLGGGIDTIYPKENATLHAEIGEQGLLLAEMPPGTEPRANLFPRRNRIISGLSLGVIVVEAAMRSGSLITARYALEQGRDVFAVPGSPLDPRSKGSNSLIKQGAPLVENAEDVIAALNLPLTNKLQELTLSEYVPSSTPQNDINETSRQKIIRALGPTPVLKDEIIRETGLTAAEVNIVLMELMIADRLHSDIGDRVSLVLEED